MNYSEKTFVGLCKINSDFAFEKQALNLFKYQYEENKIYRSYCDLIKIKKRCPRVDEIPFLPVNFLKPIILIHPKKSLILNLYQ